MSIQNLNKYTTSTHVSLHLSSATFKPTHLIRDVCRWSWNSNISMWLMATNSIYFPISTSLRPHGPDMTIKWSITECVKLTRRVWRDGAVAKKMFFYNVFLPFGYTRMLPSCLLVRFCFSTCYVNRRKFPRRWWEWYFHCKMKSS